MLSLKRLLALVAVVALGTSLPAFSQNWVPDAGTIAKLESSIKPGAIPHWGNAHSPIVTDYSRYYAGAMLKGERVVLGEFVAADIENSKATIHIVRSSKEFPVISDGSCSIVNVVYAVKSGEIVSLVCNGRA
jgi:hypothetical protein